MIKRLLVVRLFFALYLCSHSLAAVSSIPGYPESGHWPYGPVLAIETHAGSQDLLLYGEGTVLQIVDANNPENLQRLSEVETGFMISSIDILDNGQMAAVVDRNKWISLIDISDPASPSLLGRYEVEDGRAPYGVAFGPAGSNKLYAAVAPAGLWVIDISDPSMPTLDGSYIEPGTDFVFDVEVLGDFAFLADDRDGVTAIDVSNPEQPEFSARFLAAQLASHITIEGSRAYVARQGEGVHIIDLDVSGPDAVMTEAGVVPTDLAPRGFGIYYRAEVAANGSLLVTDGTRNNGLLVFDITGPASPSLLGNFEESMFSLDVIDDVAFAARPGGIGDSEVRSFRVELSDRSDSLRGDGLTPIVLDQLAAFGESFSASISGDLVVVGNENAGAVIVDASDPANPVTRSHIPDAASARYAAIVNDTLIVATYSRDLKVFDISDLDNPVELPDYDLGPGAAGYEVKPIPGTDRLLVGANSGGIQILDFSNPANPTEFASWKPEGAVNLHVAMEGDIVASGGSNFVEVVDFSNPASPVLIDSATLPQIVLDIDFQDDLVYTAAGINGVGILQYLPNNQLETLGVIPTSPTSANGVAVFGDTAYVAADTFWGILIADVSDPEDPQIVQAVNTPGNANKVDANASMVVLADREGGVRIWGQAPPPEELIFFDRFEAED
ncbi:MAG: hypothetical protein V2J20_06525 [Wenzhouxiangella sp.]|jgi:hypothetical protein|nr:hypothetical protein [Wenzhouxiangella sp.]